MQLTVVGRAIYVFNFVNSTELLWSKEEFGFVHQQI